MFIEKDGQIATKAIGMSYYGERLKEKLISRSIDFIPAGSVVVYKSGLKRILMFQILEDLKIDKLNETSLIGYEPGSITYFDDKDSFIYKIPTFRFRDIRLPLESELTLYSVRRTV